MTEATFYIILISFIVWYVFRREWRHEKEVARTGVVMEYRRGRTTAIGSPLIFPYVMIAIFALILLLQGVNHTMNGVFEMVFDFVAIITAYYIILMVILPILRKIISARACAYLWIVPAALYNFIYVFNRRNFSVPPFTVRIPRDIAIAFAVIWLVGFAVIMTWKIVSHLRFRREILENAHEVKDKEILALWDKEQDLIERKRVIPLLISDKIGSPMTIGVHDGALRTVLPAIHYNIEELELIFRHELRHVQRLDSETKAFLAFMQAFCWFNPLMWFATKKAAEDMELSCDEMVLYNADESKRRKYADLLLETAGDGRGFTTCLSATANSLRYRLKNVMLPRKRLSGAVIIALVTAVIMMTGNIVAVSTSYGSINDVILNDLGDYYIKTTSILTADDYKYKDVYGWDEEKLTDYIGSLEVTKISNIMDEPNGEKQGLFLALQGENDLIWLSIMDDILDVQVVGGGKASGLYIIEDNIDWELIESCMDYTVENPDPYPVRPTLALFFDPPLEPYEEALYAQDRLIRMTEGSNVTEFEKEEHGWSGVVGIKLDKAFLEFSYEPEDFLIEIEGMNGEGKETVKPSQLGEGNALDLKPYYARYTVYGKFNSHRHTTYEMAFYFEINPNQK
ncbi:MAG: hypothetical protein IJM96_03435 [Clostridia bacterium]|nr:hypothetical protein [Clostridia bacterium]